MHLIFRTALMLCTMLVFVAQALAADVRSYAVLPFKVNGSSGFTYLEKAIPSMLNSRLYWQGHFQPLPTPRSPRPGRERRREAPPRPFPPPVPTMSSGAT